MNEQKNKQKTGLKARQVRIAVISVVGIILLGTAAYYVFGRSESVAAGDLTDLTTFTVRRGDLVVSVTESGDVKAINSTDIVSKVEGRTSIINIVEEGTIITEEDVENGKVLVELDSSEIERSLEQQKVTFSNAEADYAEAKESLEIQIKQNESDIKAGELDVRFALMDFKKYLGETIAEEIVNQSNPEETDIDYEAILQDERLSGEAQQRLTELSNDIRLSKSDLSRAEKQLAGTKRLYEKEYVAEMELIADELDVQRLKAQHEKAQIALKLYKLYEFPKNVEELLSKYYEAIRELDRIKARARSRLAQEQARLRNREATYELQKERLNKLREQLKACTIRAPVPGQVVYGSSLLDRRERRREMIAVGEEVRERQRIISIPDTSQMKVEIKIHETWIGKIEEGQPARIIISALPDKVLEGEVMRKAPMADPEDWFNPDLKVYSTDVRINGNYDFIKTGMSAQVEIIINHLKDVLTVPIQAVVATGNQKYCFIENSGRVVRRPVEVGAFNSNFIEIKSGLSEGDRVLLNPPRIEARTAPGQPPAGETVAEPTGTLESERQQERQGFEGSVGPQVQEGPGREQADRQGPPQMELTEERIDRIMQAISRFDPDKYEQLNQLRQQDPEKFKEELRSQMRQFMQQMRQQGRQGDGPARQGGPGRWEGGQTNPDN